MTFMTIWNQNKLKLSVTLPVSTASISFFVFLFLEHLLVEHMLQHFILPMSLQLNCFHFHFYTAHFVFSSVFFC